MIDVEHKTGGLRVVLVNDDGQETWRGTFGAFLMGNRLPVTEVRDMARALAAGMDYTIVRGAADVCTLRREDAPVSRTVDLPAVPKGGALGMAEKILASRCTSDWLLAGLSSALRRDPVDAAQDAELLLSVLLARLEEVQGGAS